jgi:hypothetical protein
MDAICDADRKLTRISELFALMADSLTAYYYTEDTRLLFEIDLPMLGVLTSSEIAENVKNILKGQHPTSLNKFEKLRVECIEHPIWLEASIFFTISAHDPFRLPPCDPTLILSRKIFPTRAHAPEFAWLFIAAALEEIKRVPTPEKKDLALSLHARSLPYLKSMLTRVCQFIVDPHFNPLPPISRL